MTDLTHRDLAETEDALRRALGHDAARVTPRDRLGAILRDAHEPPVAALVDEPLRDAPPTQRTWLAAGAAAAAVVVAVVVGAAIADRPGPAVPGATGTSSAPTAPAKGTSGSSTSGTGTASTTTAGTVALPVYYVGHTVGSSGADALVREFVPTGLGGPDLPATRVTLALDAALAAKGTPYAAVGPGAVTASVVHLTASGIEVILTSDTGAITLTPIQEAAIVYTAQAAASSGDVPVTIDINPHSFGPLGRVGPFTRKDLGDTVLAPIWVDAPYRGQAYAGGRAIVVSGLASVFEAQLAWEVRQGAALIANGSATASAGAPARAPYSFSVAALPAGTYTLRVFEESAKGDGSLAAEATTTFTVG